MTDQTYVPRIHCFTESIEEEARIKHAVGKLVVCSEPKAYGIDLIISRDLTELEWTLLTGLYRIGAIVNFELN